MKRLCRNFNLLELHYSVEDGRFADSLTVSLPFLARMKAECGGCVVDKMSLCLILRLLLTLPVRTLLSSASSG